VISRYLVIVLAVGATAMQAVRGAWLETVGLSGLAVGLILLQLAGARPVLKPLAWIAFAVTAVSMAMVVLRMLPG